MVLIILDDVDQEEQLEALCDRESFGPGSRIIITSRDEHLLNAVEGDKVYKVSPLTDAEALQLFSMKAFKQDQLVGEDILKLSKEFLKYANGLPLAIKVLGSSVKGRSVNLWLSALDRLKENPEKKIINVLKVSFDGLEPREKKIFLDIACFFKGESIDRVRRILQGNDAHCPDFDVQVLLDKSMLTLLGKRLWMHDLIQELGWEIVRQECPEEPGKRSRLWLPNEIIDVLDQDKATSAVQSILLQRRTKDVEVYSVNDSFSNMERLRLLKIWNMKFVGDIKYLSKKLQFLQWHECPLDYFPLNFQPDNLVELQMQSSRIRQLWRGAKGWRMLRLIDMSSSEYLMSTPDFTEVPLLEILVLQDCTRLVEVHPSLGFLKKLISLNMRNCKSVEQIPPLISLESLKTLNLSLCSKLKKFPEVEGNMESLLELHLDGTSIEELPVEGLTGLTTLNLADCDNLLRLPSAIHSFTSLKSLILTGCSKINEIPENLNSLECLEKLNIGGTAVSDLSFLVGMKNLNGLYCHGCIGLALGSGNGHSPASLLFPALLSSLTSLVELDLRDCNLMDGAVPNDLSSLISLRELRLGGNNFVRLPDSISQLSKLETLELSNCKQLQFVPKLPSSARLVLAEDCISLMDFPNQIKLLTSIESGMTTINSLSSESSSALRDSHGFRTWKSSANAQPSEVLLTHEHTEWKRVDQVSLPLPMLMKDIELSDPSSKTSDIIYFDNEIPEWFSTISTSNPISISIPPDLADDDKWKGVTVCAVFAVKGHTALSVIESDFKLSNYFYKCTMETDVFPMNAFIFDGEEIHHLRSSSHMVLISNVARPQFPKWELNQSTMVAAKFETNNPFMEVQKCGIRLVYEQDAGWYTNLFPGVNAICLNETMDAMLKTGWLSQMDQYLKWEKLVPPIQEDSTTIRLRKNIESVLPRYLEALNRYPATYEFNLSGSPAWFESFVTDTRSGSTLVSIKLPQYLHKSKKWMGFAICVSIAEEEQEQDYHVYFKLKTGESDEVMSQELEYITDMSSQANHHQLLVVYIPRTLIPEALFTQTSTTEMRISFRSDSPGAEVQRSSGRILYHEDLAGFVETIIRCMQREHTLELHDNWVAEDWIELIGLQGGHLCSPNKCYSITQQERKFELLSQKYRNRDWAVSPPYICVFFGAEVSKWNWFMHFNEGNSAKIQLPPNLFNETNWMGIAVCGFCWASHEDSNITPDCIPDTEYNVLNMCLDSGVKSDGLFDVRLQKLFGKLQPWEFETDITFFFYIPRSKYLKFWRQFNLARVTFSSSSPCLRVYSCALRLVFKDDVEDLVRTLTASEMT